MTANPVTAPLPPLVAAAPVVHVIERHVIGLEDPDVVLDVTAKDGLVAGNDVEVYRPVRLVHPVTHRVVTDRYRIGTLRILQVRDAISLARTVGAPTRPVAPGDVVLFTPGSAGVAPSPSSGVASGPTPASPGLPPAIAGAPVSPYPAEAPKATPSPSDEAAAVSALFDRLTGASLITRIRRYERYAMGHPTGRYARVLLEEAAALRELVSLRDHEDAGAPSVRHFDAPAQILDKTPVSLTVELSGRAVGAVLQTRAVGSGPFTPTPMVPAGPNYYTATVPPERVLAPGLDYFVEAVRPSGESVPVAGSLQAPLSLPVVAVPHSGAELTQETSISAFTDYADYNRLRGNDHVWQTEGGFSIRFADTGVRALRSGFGVYRGVGGSIDDLDNQRIAPRSVGLTYGYIEGEFAVKRTVSFIARVTLGVREQGTAGGSQLGLRFGSDLVTNFAISGEVLGGIGLRGIAELSIAPRTRVPVVVRSEVTNEPAGSGVSTAGPALNALPPTVSVAPGDIGVRAMVQVGYRIVPSLVVALRASYQVRTISHAGPGMGGALEYRW